MAIIGVSAIIIYVISIAWTWKSLGLIETPRKVLIILIGLLLMLVITQVIFQITKAEINYPSSEIQGSVRTMLVLIFTGVNSLIALPQIGKTLDKINEDEIKKEQFLRRVFILGAIFILCLVIESGYMKDTQEGILHVYNSKIR